MIRFQLRMRLTGPQAPEEWYLTIVYVMVHLGTLFLLLAQSPAMGDLLEWMYIPWMAFFYVSSAFLLLGFVLRSRIIEALSLPLVEVGLLSYVAAVLSHPPYGNLQLGIAVACFLLVGCMSLGWRYGHDLMKWGRHNVE